MPLACSKCQRPNGPHRETCLYCGQKLAVDPSKGDAGIDEAAIEQALQAALGGASPLDFSGDPGLVEDSQTEALPAEKSQDPTDLPLAPMFEPPPRNPEAYAEQMLSEVSADLAIESASLPLGRRPYVLIIDGCGNAELAEPLAKLTGLDHVTTRMVAASEWDRPLIWSIEPNGLEAIAARVRDELGISATVLESRQLVNLPHPLGVVGWEEGQLLCTDRAIWMGAHPGESELYKVPFEGIRLAVPGQVAIRRFQEQRRGRWGRNKGATERREIGERRVVLLDLHSPTHFFRLVLGVTSFRGAPEYTEGSGALSLKALLEWLPDQFGGVHVEGKRVAHAQGAKAMQDNESERSSFEISGWSSWEEHSRLCRLHRRLS